MAAKKNGKKTAKKNGKTARKTSTGKTIKQVKPRSQGQQMTLWYEPTAKLVKMVNSKGLTYAEMGVTPQTAFHLITAVENHETRKTREEHAKKFSKALGLSLEQAVRQGVFKKVG